MMYLWTLNWKPFFVWTLDGDRFLVSTDVWKFILLFL
jgi:hypothetical protein